MLCSFSSGCRALTGLIISQAASSMRLETIMHVILEGPRGHVVYSSICDGNRNAVSREREIELLQEIERLACI